jgi:O-methyltransferase
MDKARVVLLDSDLYQSAKVALEFIEPMLLDGSIVIMDDWNAFDADESRGERRAFGEFLRAHARWIAQPWFQYGNYGQVFTMRAKASVMAMTTTLPSLIQGMVLVMAA